ncbi:MAG: anhydro-N-acetylmuramic acid kinase [Pseudomonadota bacterium]
MTRWAIGLMSGTSLDGADAALLNGDGSRVHAFGACAYREYSDGERKVFRAAMRRAAETPTSELRRHPEMFASEATLSADIHAELIERLLAQDAAETPELIGFHGQTLIHRPEEGFTLQIGDAARLAKRIDVPVIHDLRLNDMAQGGQGAPLAPFYHFALARMMEADAPVAFLNIGGVANVTWVDPRAAAPEAPGALLAFDTGPGNALLNDLIGARTGAAWDTDGAAAAAGRVDEGALKQLLDNAYFEATPPKSLDRGDFPKAPELMRSLGLQDAAATLTAFTAASIERAQDHFKVPVSRWLVCGGGRHNPQMMRMLSERLSAPVEPVEAVGFNGDMIEAQAFAHLALRSNAGLPLSAPATTGVQAPATGGQLSTP